MESNKRIASLGALAAVAVICLAPTSQAANKYRRFNFTGVSPESPTTGNEGLQITAGNDTCTVNFPAGITNNGDAAQEIINDCNGGNFTITRVGNEVTICHATRTAKLRKVNIANKRSNSAYTLAALRSDNLLEFRGLAAGGGVVSVSNDWIQANVPTSPGQTTEELVDQIVEQLAAQTDFGTPEYSFGTEYTAPGFDLPPQDSADLGIYQLGPLDLDQTQFFSSDPGIEIWQEPGPQGYPTTCAGDVGPCACGNQGGPGEGCMNSTGAGSLLDGEGIASLTEDSFDLVVTQTPNQPGIFFQGENTAGAGLPFGDGVRCCGGQIARLGTYLPAGNMTGLQGGIMLEGPGWPVSEHPANAGLQPGDSRCYQWWHRDPGPSNPCQQDYFNLSNSIEATWGA